VAKNCAEARVVATDFSAEALECAKGNAVSNGVSDRIEFRLGDGFSILKDEHFDLIVSNPPYIPSAEIESLQPEVRDWEPRAALDGGVDGLDWYRRLAVEAAPHLVSSGKVILEFGDGQEHAIQKIFQQEKWIVEALVEDYNRHARIVMVTKGSET
jgi:release factor glutamine methyltransferase